MECLCGCGEEVSTASFKPGHDQKLRISLEKRAGGIERLRDLVDAAEKDDSSDQSNAEECKGEIDDIYKTINSDQAEYDKQLLTLSSGFLAVSLAFIKDVVPLKDAEFLPLLYSSFILLFLCIILVLFSYQFSIAGLFKAKKYYDNKKIGPFPYNHAEGVKRVNWFCGFLFAFGVLLLVFFVIFNLHHEADITMSRTGDGAYIKTPSNNNGEDRGSHIKVPAPQTTNKPSSGGNSGNDSSKK